MMRPFLGLKKDCSEAVQWISEHLKGSGLQVVQTFDLHTTRFDHNLCSCPHHGTEQCDCEQHRCTMVVLLVYEDGFPPASVVAHGHDGQTWFTIPDSPQTSIHSSLKAAIQTALLANIFLVKLDDLADVT